MSLLSDALKNKLIPWSRQNSAERFIIAREKMSAAEMPDGVTLIRRKIVGPRVVVKNRRFYDNTRGLKAHWPEAGLGEWEQHKLICVLNGRIDFQLGNYAVQCGAGFFLTRPPGTPEPMRHCNAKGSACDLLSIILNSHAIQCFIQHDDGLQDCSNIRENYLFRNESLTSLFQILTEEIFSGRENSIRIAAGSLALFWEILLREIDEQHYVNPGPVGRPVDRLNTHKGFEADLLHYIQMHLNQSLTLENAARGLYLSRTQFARRMRQETGKTFIEFLNDYRLAEAKVLLCDSDWTISAIAGFLGFHSYSYFQYVFRRDCCNLLKQYHHESTPQYSFHHERSA